MRPEGSQSRILDIFSQIWRTKDLLVSFDDINVSLPINDRYGRTDIQPTTPWLRTYEIVLVMIHAWLMDLPLRPDINQAAENVDHFEMYQEIANRGLSGPDEGGLDVLRVLT